MNVLIVLNETMKLYIVLKHLKNFMLIILAYSYKKKRYYKEKTIINDISY